MNTFRVMESRLGRNSNVGPAACDNVTGGSNGQFQPYYNQFVLGPRAIEDLAGWQRIQLGDSLFLTAHPGLNVCVARSSGKYIVLIGFILDPFNPKADDVEILNGLIGEMTDIDALIRSTYKYGGRWVIVADDGTETRLFNDASGLRQACFTIGSSLKERWCTSQPGLIAKILGLAMDSVALDFVNSYAFRDDREYRWPGYSSPYREVRHMLPNHCLDLKSWKCYRYWPDKPLSPISLEQAERKVADALRGLMLSASERFDLALSLTSGLDSRLVLAASREITEKLSYITVRQLDKPDDHPEVMVPSAMLSALGLEHRVIKSSLLRNQDFLTAFYESVPFAHDIYAPDAQAIYERYRRSKVAVTGSVCEIARCSFREMAKRFKGKELGPVELSALQSLGTESFALECFKDWISGLGNIYNIHFLDMFEWEQGHGNWLAMCQLEFDTAWKDIFTPFNSRQLIVDMLSVDEKFRRPPDYLFYRKMIERLWPKLLDYPINPHKKKGILRKLGRRAVKAAARMLPQ